MPVSTVYRHGRQYYRWGQHGALYRTRREAICQMKAAFAHGYRRRSRPRQHVRHLRSGGCAVVNRGVSG